MQRHKAKSSDDESERPVASSKAERKAETAASALPTHRIIVRSDTKRVECILVISCLCCCLLIIATVLGYVYLYRTAFVLDGMLRLYEVNGGSVNKPLQPSLFQYLLGSHDSFLPPDIYAADRRNKIAWIVGNDIRSGYLDHVIRMFREFGWIVVTDQNVTRVPDFDILWSHNYPFLDAVIAPILQNLKPHQRLNKVPNFSTITNKLVLSTSGGPFLPASFRVPEDMQRLLAYSKANPNKKFLRKSEEHRNIHFVGSHTELQVFLQAPPTRTFVQEYIEPVSLIAGRKYDLGVYTLVTNVRPLRVFTWDSEIGFRFCPKLYNQDDFSDPDTYVIADDYAPIWTIPELQEFYVNNGYTNKETFVSYLKRSGHENARDIVERIVKECKRVIAQAILFREQELVNYASPYRSLKQFFELVRFDFTVTEDWQVFLLEVSMSPNLSSGHFVQNRRIFEQVLYNMFTLLGLGNDHFCNFESQTDTMEMQVTNKDIAVYQEFCNGDTGVQCKNNCFTHFLCRLCMFCMNDRVRFEMKHAYVEYNRRYNFGLAYPPILTREEAQLWSEENPLANGINVTALNEWDYVEFLWFRGKCLSDARWCAP